MRLGCDLSAHAVTDTTLDLHTGAKEISRPTLPRRVNSVAHFSTIDLRHKSRTGRAGRLTMGYARFNWVLTGQKCSSASIPPRFWTLRQPEEIPTTRMTQDSKGAGRACVIECSAKKTRCPSAGFDTLTMRRTAFRHGERTCLLLAPPEKTGIAEFPWSSPQWGMD